MQEELFEQANSFKYLGTTVNTDNSIDEEIKERITAGNKAYHVHKKHFFFLSPNAPHMSLWTSWSSLLGKAGV